MKCCGTYLNGANEGENSWVDYGPYTLANNGTHGINGTNGFIVPKSCCLQFEYVDSCRKDPTITPFNVTGCFSKIEDTFVFYRGILLIIVIFITVVLVQS